MLPFPPLGDPPHPGIELTSPVLAGGFFTTEPPEKPMGVADVEAWARSYSVMLTGWAAPAPRFVPGTLGSSDVAGGPRRLGSRISLGEETSSLWMC